MNIQDIITEIRFISKHYPKIQKVYLFGSHARNEATEQSDIDLAVSGLPFHDPEWQLFRDELENISTLRMIDCHNLEMESDQFKQKILEEGIILYEHK